MTVGSIAGAGSQPLLKIQGLGSGLKTEEIISALMGVERKPVTQLSEEKAVTEEQARSLTTLQSDLEGLATSAGELSSQQLFAKRQTANSSEPARVSAAVNGGAASGGYQVSVSALASAAQRVFAFASPSSAQTVSIYGHAVQLGAGETLAELANAINSDSELTVNAAAIGEETLVLSARQTGKVEGDFIEVSDPGGALTEKPAFARAGTNAEYSIDGIGGESSSNTLTEAIPGVTLTLSAVTTTSGPVSIDITPPAISSEKIEEQVKSFVTQYNTALAKVQSEVSTKPQTGLQAEAESGTGLLFGDIELEEMSGTLRQSIYTPLAGLPSTMSSLASIGVTAAGATEGQLTIEESTLQEALKSNPEGVEKMLEAWGTSFKKTVEAYAGAGGTLEARIQGDHEQATYTAGQITSLEEALAIRQHTLEAQYVALEAVMRKASSESSFLSGQLAKLASTSTSTTAAEP